jgi:hypothetical protein
MATTEGSGPDRRAGSSANVEHQTSSATLLDELLPDWIIQEGKNHVREYPDARPDCAICETVMVSVARWLGA